MKQIFIIVMILIIFFQLSGCEPVIIDAQFPYQEKIIVRGILQDRSTINNIKISKTLPPLENYSEEKSFITDANVSIEVNQIKYPLFYAGQGNYKNDNVIVKSGLEYKLLVDWNGKSISASTRIPDRTIIDKTEQRVYRCSCQQHWVIEVSAVFRPSTNAVYIGGMDEIKNNVITSRFMTLDIKRTKDTSEDGKIHLIILEFNTPDTVTSLNYVKNLTRFVESYDEPFYNYFRSKNNGVSQSEIDENIFGTNGGNVQWNVTGNGFGLFIGKCFIR
jgi:hypothetical protein